MQSFSFLRGLLCVATSLAAGSALQAQSFNVDVGEDLGLGSFGVPSSTYGAAAAQPGIWNGLTDGVAGQTTPAFGAGSPWWVTTLNDLAGAPTAVTVSAVMSGNSVGDFVFNNGLTFGDDQALMDDVGDVGGVGSTATWTINGLSNGFYDVYLYAWAPDSATFITNVSTANSSSTNPQTSGGNWPGNHALGTTYTLHSVTVTTGTITISLSTISGFGSNNGFQLVRTGDLSTGTSYCFGDGTGAACPCLNNGSAGHGCANSVNAAGGLLGAMGVASVAADTLTLQGSSMTSANCLYFQGTAQSGGGSGTAFGDGLRCATGSVVRITTRLNVSGASQYPTSGDPSVSVKGLVPPTGGQRYYQIWYRNADPSFCTTSTFNLTNGLGINWVP